MEKDGQDMREYEAMDEALVDASIAPDDRPDEATAALNLQLYELGQEGKRHPERRRQLANQMFRLIQNSGKLGRFGATPQDYAEARSAMEWHFANNLWEAKGSTKSAYCDCEHILNRLNDYLKRWLWREVPRRRQRETKVERSRQNPDTGRYDDPAEQIPAPDRTDSEFEVAFWAAVRSDSALNQTPIGKQSDLTLAWLIEQRLLLEATWPEISTIAAVKEAAIKAIWQRKCLPWMRDWCQRQGWR